MTDRGHEVIFYGHQDSDVQCSEFVPVTDNSVLEKAYGGYDWQKNQFRHNVGDSAYQEFARRCIPEITKRAQRLDIVHCPFGYAHQSIANAAEQAGAIVVEGGIGYTSGHFARWRAYESHAVRNQVEGSKNPQDWYSRVIPNYFDLEDFTYNPVKQDYILYLGRLTEIKGISTCIRAAELSNKKLIIAGQGDLASLGWGKLPPNVEFVGYADVETRRNLMQHAKGLIIATTYLEPFGGVVVEALLSGTPIITPFFGAFAEIQTEKTGFLCSTLRDYVYAINNIEQIGPQNCRERGLQYSLENIAPKFEKWFSDITEVYTGNGWMSV